MSRAYLERAAGIAAVIALSAIWFLAGYAAGHHRAHRPASAQPYPRTPPPPAPTACRGGVLPDRRCTPGATNPAVTQRTAEATICKPGWAASVRPPSSEMRRVKALMLGRYGYAGRPPADFQLDHLIPLELGGAPRDLRNLWPEPNDFGGSASKDHVENKLHREVCAGTLALAAARRLIRTDWREGR